MSLFFGDLSGGALPPYRPLYTVALPPYRPLYTWIPPLRTPHRCPVCDGRGVVPPGFYSRLGAVGTALQETCRSCAGKALIWEPAA